MQNESNIYPFNEIDSLLKSNIARTKEEILKGTLPLDISINHDNKSSIDNRLISQTMCQSTRSKSNCKLPITEDVIVIQKLRMLNKKTPTHLLNPKEIIKQKHRQVQEQIQGDKKTVRILRTTKSLFRSLSKEIDKRTKEEFGLIEKSFDFLQYDNPFHLCLKLNLNSSYNNSNMSNCFNLPFLRMHSSFINSNFQQEVSKINNNTNNRGISTNRYYPNQKPETDHVTILKLPKMKIRNNNDIDNNHNNKESTYEKNIGNEDINNKKSKQFSSGQIDLKRGMSFQKLFSASSSINEP